ncbi:MAG: hypothetical protein ACUVTW_10780 [Thermogutta sp.]
MKRFAEGGAERDVALSPVVHRLAETCGDISGLPDHWQSFAELFGFWTRKGEYHDDPQ